MKQIRFVGGDERSRWAALTMQEQGYEVHCHGVPGYADEALPQRFDTVVLPFPSVSGALLRGKAAIPLEEVVCRLDAHSRVFGGLLGSSFPGGIDLYGSEPLTTINAAITAEAALGLAMERSPFALLDSRCLVLGFGRVAKQLVLRLLPMGAHVCVGARKAADRALASSLGCEVRPLPMEPGKFDFVFNTVPAPVLSADRGFPEHCVLLELASAPYGLPEDGRICAPGLPGKFAPASAGRAYARSILEFLEGGEMP